MSDATEGRPIVVTTRVETDPEHAFDIFTGKFGDWWDPRLTPDASTYEGADVPGVVGGTISLRHDGEVFPIGEVQEWEPGARFAMTFHLALPREHPTTGGPQGHPVFCRLAALAPPPGFAGLPRSAAAPRGKHPVGGSALWAEGA